MTPETFKRKLRNLESAYRRLDRGELNGRNATGSDRTREMHYRELDAALQAELYLDDSPLFLMLDTEPATAWRWSVMERRSVGLPV